MNPSSNLQISSMKNLLDSVKDPTQPIFLHYCREIVTDLPDRGLNIQIPSLTFTAVALNVIIILFDIAF